MKIAINPFRVPTGSKVSKIDNIHKLWFFNDDIMGKEKYLGLIEVEEIEGRILMKITMHGTVDLDVDAYGLDIETIKGKTERHKVVEFRKSD